MAENNSGGLAGLMSGLASNSAGSPGGLLGGLKNKDAPQQMGDVPMASGSFYQPMEQPARSQLLQTMMQRSRMGRNQGA